MSNYWDEVKNPSKTAEPPLTTVLVPTNEALIRKINAAATTLTFIAAVSVINLGLTYVQSPIRFSFGVVLTDLVLIVGAASHESGLPVVALGIDALILGLLGFA